MAFCVLNRKAHVLCKLLYTGCMTATFCVALLTGKVIVLLMLIMLVLFSHKACLLLCFFLGGGEGLCQCKTVVHIEGFQPEWCISTIYHA